MYIQSLIVIFGLIIGSFLNVCIYRIPRKESIVFPPSSCPNCGYNLKPWDMIPVFSYFILLKGKCRSCKEPIRLRYPIVESLNAILYLLVFNEFGLSVLTLKYVLLASMLIIITFIDLDLMIIPDRMNLFVFVLGCIFFLISPEFSVLSVLLGTLAGGLFFLLVAVLTNAMGGGDIKLIAALGVVLGLKGILITMYLAFILGAIIGLILIITKIKGRKDAIPFGPYICIGAMVTALYTTEILGLYSRLISG